MKLAKLLAVLSFALALVVPAVWTTRVEGQGATQAPTGFDTLTNGMVTQDVHEADRANMEEVENIGWTRARI